MSDVSQNNINKNKLIHPFESNLSSFPSFIYKVFQAFYLYDEHVFAVAHEHGTPSRNTSKIEFQWAAYMEFEYPAKLFRHNVNHPKSQKYFKECIPDLWSPITKEAHFFNGCLYHGHLNCKINPNATPETTNFLNKTYELLNEEQLKKFEKLLLNNPNEISSVTCHWECNFTKNIKKTPGYKRFETNVLTSHPLQRLKPRTSLRGGFLQAFALKWDSKLHCDEDFYCLDINGLYSYCAIKYPYVIGKYKVLIGSDVNKILIKDNKLYFNESKMSGSILLRILPPQDLYVPFLPYRKSDGKSVLTLCCKCAEINFKNLCKHSINERSLVSCYMINEIEFALSLGYKILEIFESHCYFEEKFILKSFVQRLVVLKLENSDCLSHLTTKEQKDNYCTFLNKSMQLEGPLMLKKESISENSSHKELYKLAANALFGKLQQRNDHTKSLYASSQLELEEKFFENEDNIQNIICHNDLLCELLIRPDPLKIAPNRQASCYIGSQITSYARQEIYTHIMSLLNSKATVFYVDTDSVYFSISKQIPIPVPISHSLGHFKHVIKGQILSFHCLGPKNYSISYRNEKNEVLLYSKVRGLTLGNVLLSNEINIDLYNEYISNFVQAKPLKKEINQLKIKNAPKMTQLKTSKLEILSFTNQINIERKIVLDNIYSSLPYGFIQST